MTVGVPEISQVLCTILSPVGSAGKLPQVDGVPPYRVGVAVIVTFLVSTRGVVGYDTPPGAVAETLTPIRSVVEAYPIAFVAVII